MLVFLYKWYYYNKVNLIMKEYMLLNKSNLRKLTSKDISIELPDLKNSFDSKSETIAQWLVDWIKEDLKSGKMQETNILPSKEDLAYTLGVSVGTIQNSLRLIEDRGYVESKQRIGTLVRDWKKPIQNLRKLTSKREKCIDMIKKYILDNKMRIGEKMPSSRVMASLLEISANTTRLALENLCFVGILEHDLRNTKEFSLLVKNNKFNVKSMNATLENITLVEKVEKEIENYISQKMSVGEKMPTHDILSEKFKVSVKTVHDALEKLIKNGILLARRGRYGTVVVQMPNNKGTKQRKEDLIFAPAKDTAFYNYEKTQNHIKKLIAENYDIGSKLPSIMKLSKQLDLSPNTIRKALNNLADEGYLRFSRGRYGGTFVIDIPDTSAQSFKWLAVNPKYVEVYN